MSEKSSAPQKPFKVPDEMMEQFGLMLAGWVLEPESRPTNLDELESQLATGQRAAGLSGNKRLIDRDRIKRVRFIDIDDDELVFALPSETCIRAMIDWAKGRSAGEYPALPSFYGANDGDRVDPRRIRAKTAVELYYSRLSDYTTAFCE
ncbi:MAG: hypothetical protein AAF493_02215 [Pseudomonadota bacterium]